MRVLPDPQGSEGWRLARLGRLTASDFDRLVTPTGKVARGSAITRLCAEKVAEWILGYELDPKETEAMAWGKSYEPHAADAYAIETGNDVEPVGLCLHDSLDGVGASPDRLVGEDGLLEIKCPFAPAVQAMYLMDLALLETAYRSQVQGQLWVTGRGWADLYAWHPEIPSVRVRVQPDPEWVGVFEEAAREALQRIQAVCERLRGQGVVSGLEAARRRALAAAAKAEREAAEPWTPFFAGMTNEEHAALRAAAGLQSSGSDAEDPKF